MSIDSQIDEALYSRTLYVLGHDAMEKMATSRVLIIGLSGLGLEIAKNIVLSGVNNIVLVDDELVTDTDSGSNFYLQKNQIPHNTSRADFLKHKIMELNPNAFITSVVQNKLSESFLSASKFTVVVVVNQSLSDAITYSHWCRSNSIKFIQTSTIGLFTNCFVDFGESFSVIDKNGEEISQSVVDDIEVINTDLENVNVIRVYFDTKTSHKLQDGDHVQFEPSPFPDTYNQNECLLPIKVINTRCIEVGWNTHYSFNLTIFKDFKGLYLTQVIRPITFSSNTFEKAITDWSSYHNNCSDFANLKSLSTLHASYLYFSERDKYNIPVDFMTFTSEVNRTAVAFKCTDELNSNRLALIYYTFQGEVGPINSIMGGFVAQEVLKLCGRKFTPLHGWLYLDFYDIFTDSQIEQIQKQLNTSTLSLNIENQAGGYVNSSKLVNAIGLELTQKLSETSLFMIGSGAIGCEHLKNFAMLNIATAPNTKLTFTDMDTIEKSNLSRQFLFRSHHVGLNKATVARESVIEMNPQMNIDAHQNIVSKESENIYSDKFFRSNTVVVNALDNIDARRYVDNRCVQTQRPLFESGTLGTKGNTQVVLPFLTESYSASHDPPEESIPQCTLKNFPHKIEHTIAYARNLFEGLFNKSIEVVKGYMLDPDHYIDNLSSQYEQEEAIQIIKGVLDKHYPSDFTDCIRWALHIWTSQFKNQITQLTTSYPKDQNTSEGLSFWSGTKRFPTPLEFDLTNDTHLDFIVSASNLWAKIFDVKPSRFIVRDVIANIVAKEINFLPSFVPDKHLIIPVNDEEAKKMESVSSISESDLQKEKKQLLLTISERIKLMQKNVDNLRPEKFEKDDSTHVDFITAASNLRATNYGIKTVSAFETKKIAGKIIPAIATTTAIVSGLISIELMKYINGVRDVTKYRNFFLNLALPMITSSEPEAPEFQYINNKKYSYWDQLEMSSSSTVEEIIQHISTTFNVEIDMINHGTCCFYSDLFGSKETREQKKKMTLSQISQKMKNKSSPESLYYEVLVSPLSDDPDEEIKTYSLQLRLID